MKLSKETLKNLINEVMEESEKKRVADIMQGLLDDLTPKQLTDIAAEKEAEEGRPAMGMPGVEEPMSPEEQHRQYLLKKHSNEGKKR